MLESKFDVNTQDVLSMFADLELRRQKQVHRTTLRQGSNILIRQARRNLRSVVGSSITKRHPKTNISMSGGIRYSIDRDATQSTIHIMKEYRLKWFEMGTKDRYTMGMRGKSTNKRKYKSGVYRGKMTATWFFKKAVDQSEKEVFSTLDENLQSNIIKIYDKYK